MEINFSKMKCIINLLFISLFANSLFGNGANDSKNTLSIESEFSRDDTLSLEVYNNDVDLNSFLEDKELNLDYKLLSDHFNAIDVITDKRDTLWRESQLMDTINSHLSKLILQNYENDQKNESHKNKYVLYYNYGQPMDFPTCTDPYVAVGPFKNGVGPWSGGTPGAEWTALMDSLCTFNNNVGNLNWAGIKKYAIFYGFPSNAGKTKLTSELASQSAIVPFMEQIGANENYSTFTNARDDINNFILQNQEIPPSVLSAAHRIITIESLYYDKNKPETNKHDVLTKTYFIKDDLLTAQVFQNYLNYCNTSTTPIDPYLDYGGKLGTRVRGFVNFFSDYGNYNNDFEACDIPATAQIAQDIRDCYCDDPNMPLWQGAKVSLFDFVKFIDKAMTSSATYNPYSTTSWNFYDFASTFDCANPGTEFINTIFPEYANSTFGGSLAEYIMQYKIGDPSIPVADVNPHAYIFWLSVATITDFENLSYDHRIRFLNIFKDQHSGGTYYLLVHKAEGNGTVSLTQIIYEILYNVPFNTTSAQSVITGLTQDGPLLKWLFDEVCNDLFVSDESEHKVIHAFNRLFEIAEGGEAAMQNKCKVGGEYEGKGIVWQPGPWFYNPAMHYDYETYGSLDFVNNSGKVSFQAELYLDGSLFTDAEQIETFVLKDPFTPCPLSIGENFSWMTEGGFLQDLVDCSMRGGMDCGRVRFFPIISVAWYIEKLNELKILAGAIAAVETASMFTGVGTFVRLAKVTGSATRVLRVRRAMAGFTSAVEAADLIVPNAVAIGMTVSGGWTQAEIDGVNNSIKSVTTVLAMAGGITQIGDFVYGLSKWRQLKHTLTDGPNPSDMSKVMNDVGKFLSDFPDQTGKLLSEFGITNSLVRSTITSTTHLPTRIAIIGELADPALSAYKNNDGVAKIIKSVLGTDDPILQFYGEISGARKAKMFQDILEGGMSTLFASNRGYIRGWDILDELGTPAVLIRDESIIVSVNRLNDHLLFNNLGGANKLHATNIHRYTVNGNYLNNPMRGPYTDSPLFTPDVNLPNFEYQSYLKIISGLLELRATSRLHTGLAYRGRTFTQNHFDILFGTGSPTDIPLKGFQSATLNIDVAKHFLELTGVPAPRVKVIMKITSKDGVYIDDISDWGTNLGPIYHAGEPPIIQIQQEVLMLEGMFRKTSAPYPYLEGGIPKVDADGTPWMVVDLEELGTAFRTISN